LLFANNTVKDIGVVYEYSANYHVWQKQRARGEQKHHRANQ